MIEEITEMGTSSLFVIHLGMEGWRSYEVRITSGKLKEENDTGNHPYQLSAILTPLLQDPKTYLWWKLCFFQDGNNIGFDDYYLNFPVSENTDMTFKQLSDEIAKSLPDPPIPEESTVFATGTYSIAFPLLYLLQQKYSCRLIIQQRPSSLECPTLPLYSDTNNEMYPFECFGHANKKLVYLPYHPGKHCRQAWVWVEPDSMRNFYLCMINNNQETRIIPWKN